MFNVVFKFVEPPEKGEKILGRKSRVKFKIMSLKVEVEVDYIPELVNCIQHFVTSIYFHLMNLCEPATHDPMTYVELS